MINVKITLSIWCAMMMNPKTPLFKNRGKLNMTRVNWMKNKARPDSMIKKIRVFLVMSEDFLAEVKTWSFGNTVKILQTIKPVTRAFTTMEMVRLVIVTAVDQEVG